MRAPAALIIALVFCLPTHAQTLTASADGEVELWPSPHGNYWHRATLDLSGALTHSGWSGTAYFGLTAWGRKPIDSNKIESNSQASPLTAEWIRVLEREHGAYIDYGSQTFRVGVQLHRRSVSHVGRFRDLEGRHDRFPVDGGWKAGRDNCKNAESDVASWVDGHCPSLGYWQRAGLRFSGQQESVRWVLATFLWTSKDVTTLQPELWRGRAEWQFSEHWRFRATANMDSERRLYGNLSVSRSLGPVRIGIVGGRLNAPDWTTQDLWRIGLKLSD